MATFQTTDDRRFDEQVARRGKVVLEVLAGVGILAAVMMSLFSLMRGSEIRYVEQPAKTGMAGMMGSASGATPVAAVAATAPRRVVTLKVIPEGKKGPEGTLHDEFTVTNFNVEVGVPMTLHVDNTDDTVHSITSTPAGVNIVIKPGTHDYTLLVNKPGTFKWDCAFPCDEWAMSHPGYMAGYITAS